MQGCNIIYIQREAVYLSEMLITINLAYCLTVHLHENLVFHLHPHLFNKHKSDIPERNMVINEAVKHFNKLKNWGLPCLLCYKIYVIFQCSLITKAKKFSFCEQLLKIHSQKPIYRCTCCSSLNKDNLKCL